MFLGFIAIGLILQNDPLKAGTLIIIAGLLDAFDGKIARLLGIESQFGTMKALGASSLMVRRMCLSQVGWRGCKNGVSSYSKESYQNSKEAK